MPNKATWLVNYIKLCAEAEAWYFRRSAANFDLPPRFKLEKLSQVAENGTQSFNSRRSALAVAG